MESIDNIDKKYIFNESNNLFTKIPAYLYNYAKTVTEISRVDSSHDLTHFINVYNYASQIIDDMENIINDDDESVPNSSFIDGFSKEDSIEIILYAAFIHDIVDGKYFNVDMAVENLKMLFKDNNYPSNKVDVIIFLITHMSFSKRIERKNQGLPMIEPGIYHTAMCIVCDADQLDGYRIQRVIDYQYNIYKDLQEPERSLKMTGWVKTILVKRILLYKDNYFNTSTGKEIASILHRPVEQYVEEYLKEVEMFEY